MPHPFRVDDAGTREPVKTPQGSRDVRREEMGARARALPRSMFIRRSILKVANKKSPLDSPGIRDGDVK